MPKWFKGVIGCPVAMPEQGKVKLGRKIKLSEDVKITMGFKKTLMDRINDVIMDGFGRLQKLILPKDFKMPCLFGDCDLHKQAKNDKKKILMYNQKTFDLKDNDEDKSQKSSSPTSNQQSKSGSSSPITPNNPFAKPTEP